MKNKRGEEMRNSSSHHLTILHLVLPMSKIKPLLITIFILITLLSSAQLVLANSMSDEGQKIRDLEERKIFLEDQVQTLEKEVAALGSLTRIQKEAADLGLVSNSQAFEYLSPPKLAQAP
jgi:cell division protein FtsL